MTFRFIKPILLSTLLLAVVTIWPLLTFLEPVRDEVLVAALVTFINAFVGMAIVEIAIDKTSAVFMTLFLGGMAARVIGLLIVFAVLLVLGFDPLPITFSLMGFYFYYLVVEIVYAVKVHGRHPSLRSRDWGLGRGHRAPGYRPENSRPKQYTRG